MRKLLLIALLPLAGCVSMVEREGSAYNTWERSDLEEVGAGKITWSEHYKRAFDKASALPSNLGGKAELMRESADMTVISQAYEAGRVTPEQFESARRNLDVSRTERNAYAAQQNAAADASASAARRSAAMGFAAGMQGIANQNAAYYQQRAIATPPAPYVNMNPAPVNCLTQPSGNGVMTTCR